VSLSGGEPFEQAAGLAEFLQALRSEPGASSMTAIAFTGYTVEGLRRGPRPWQELLARLDLLVDGPYLAEKACDLPLRGSANQRLVALTPAGAALAARAEAGPKGGFSVTIAPDGEVLLTGFPPHELVRTLTRLSHP
jgi:anaerobic ribonucleoside-triphosphate reductase activating protein